MVNANADAIGIIFPNTYDTLVPELVRKRPMASVPFAGRYRMIDFCLSGMVNAGVESVRVLVQNNYLSLMDHLGNGREWDLARKRGGLFVAPPNVSQNSGVWRGRIDALADSFPFIEEKKESHVIISDCNIASALDYTSLIDTHSKNDADITIVYEKSAIPNELKEDNQTFDIDADGKITKIYFNDYRKGQRNISMNVIIFKRDVLVKMIKNAMMCNFTDFEREIIAPAIKTHKVMAYEYKGYHARIYNLKSYFEENMRLLNIDNLNELFCETRPVYTKVRDEAPVRYAIDSKLKNCTVADGCYIEGEAENCILFRGVKIGKGASVRNCILMQGTVIEENVNLSNTVTDKNVIITAGKVLHGDDNYPVFIEKNTIV